MVTSHLLTYYRRPWETTNLQRRVMTVGKVWMPLQRIVLGRKAGERVHDVLEVCEKRTGSMPWRKTGFTVPLLELAFFLRRKSAKGKENTLLERLMALKCRFKNQHPRPTKTLDWLLYTGLFQNRKSLPAQSLKKKICCQQKAAAQSCLPLYAPIGRCSRLHLSSGIGPLTRSPCCRLGPADINTYCVHL